MGKDKVTGISYIIFCATSPPQVTKNCQVILVYWDTSQIQKNHPLFWKKKKKFEEMCHSWKLLCRLWKWLSAEYQLNRSGVCWRLGHIIELLMLAPVSVTQILVFQISRLLDLKSIKMGFFWFLGEGWWSNIIYVHAKKECWYSKILNRCDWKDI